MTLEAYLTRKDNGDTFYPDVVVDVSFSFSVKVTENPIEDGSSVSDHAQPQNETITLTALVTETPITGKQRNSSLTGVARLRAARDWLEGAKGAIVTLTSNTMGVKSSCLVKRVTYLKNALRKLEFKVELVQVTLASSSTVFISEDSIPATEENSATLADEQDIGEQSTTSTDTEPVAEEADKSYLASLVDAF